MYNGRRPRDRYANILRKGNINWDHSVVDMWEKVLRKQEYRKKKNAITIMHRKAKKRRASKLLSVAEDLRIRGLMQATIDKIGESQFFKSVHMPKYRALMIDHLFIALEPNFVTRHMRIKRILSGKHTIEDRLWVQIMWDYTKKDVPSRYSHRLTAKYQKYRK